jgi:hypothetical protein
MHGGHLLLLSTLILGTTFCQGQLSTNGTDPTYYLSSQAKGPTYTVAGSWQQHQHLLNFEEVKRVTGDTWGVLPQEYDSAFKNPCWRDAGQNLKCLPYFQVKRPCDFCGILHCIASSVNSGTLDTALLL